ncbi:MAG: nucleotidyltransferase family protein [Clostridia bacterium]|nr:nucleotidyltransferase family protein [Clostridia bacterium]
MYETEYSQLLSLIGAQVGGVKTPVAVSDYKTLILLAKQHSVLNILYFALKDDPCLPPECRTVLERQLFSTAHQQASQEVEAKRVFAMLTREGIRHLPMKGEGIRSLYPAPEMRISCDVDIYYDKAARSRMDELFAALGYEKEESDPNHTAYKKGFVSMEMHHNLLTDFDNIDRYYRNVWDRLIPDGEFAFRMRDEDFYIYHLVHTMKHFAHGGTGIRSVLDTYVYLHKKTDMDMAYLRAELEKLALWDFHLTLAELAEVWFGGMEMPADLAGVSAYVLDSGTYGKTLHTVTNLSSGSGGRLGFYIRRAFPPYRYMAEKYPSLRRFPPALPFYWIGRIFRAAFGGERYMANEVKASGKADAALREQLSAVMARAGLGEYR